MSLASHFRAGFAAAERLTDQAKIACKKPSAHFPVLLTMDQVSLSMDSQFSPKTHILRIVNLNPATYVLLRCRSLSLCCREPVGSPK